MANYAVNDPYANRNDAPFINAKEAFRPTVRPKVPLKIDEEVSKIVGKPISVTDPRLIQEVNKWRQYNTDEKKFDNHLQDPKKRADLKRILG